MTGPRIGELFAGYGGLGMGVQAALGGDIAWVSEYDKGPSKILAHRFPGVPNHGDITTIDWSQVEPVDILTGGSPCQDLSHAGARKGMTEGTRSNLWVAMREAIAQLRPSLVVWENVRGAYSAEANSALEHCSGCMGGPVGSDGPVLRALGRVLGDLSDLGYVGGWHGLRACDIGAPHRRDRVFVVAHPAGERRTRRSFTWADVVQDGSQSAHGGASGRTPLTLLPTPTTQDGANNGGPSQFERNTLPLNAQVLLLPTRAVNDMGAGYTVDQWDAWTDRMKAEHGNGNGHGKSLHIEAARLPDSTYFDTLATLDPSERLAAAAEKARWGDYEECVTRWSRLFRPPPAPTNPDGKDGARRLNPAFSEWMMGLPAGWVTDVPGITRNEALRALGNGVVPQQCAAALRVLLAADEVAA